MTRGRNMKENRKILLLFVLCLLFVGIDMAKGTEDIDDKKTAVNAAALDSIAADSVNSGALHFPGMKSNELIRGEELDSIFCKIRGGKDIVRIVHIGDSHVRGHVFSVAARHRLEKEWGDSAVEAQKISYQTTAIATETGKPGIVYSAIGRNGAVCAHFLSGDYMSRVKELNPDLVIVSLGTNESYGSFSGESFRNNLDSLCVMINDSCPSAKIMLTTLPGSFKRIRVRSRNRKGRRRYSSTPVENKNTEKVRQIWLNYAEEHNLAVWDLYGIMGGDASACKNWRRAKFMRSDFVHYTNEGYTYQGELMAEAIIKQYNKYVARH